MNNENNKNEKLKLDLIKSISSRLECVKYVFI